MAGCGVESGQAQPLAGPVVSTGAAAVSAGIDRGSGACIRHRADRPVLRRVASRARVERHNSRWPARGGVPGSGEKLGGRLHGRLLPGSPVRQVVRPQSGDAHLQLRE